MRMAPVNLVDEINAQLESLHLTPLNAEQLACLADPHRAPEAAAMLDDLTARCGVRLRPPQGEEFGPYTSEKDAIVQAEEIATRFDAVAIDAMSTDDHRSYGGVEYYVTGFKGASAALDAARRSDLELYWVNGERHLVD